MKREVLLLNSCEQVLKIISWKKAVKLLLSGKATKPHTPYKKTHTIRTVTGKVEIPAAIVLLRFHELPELDVRPTRRNIFKRDNHTCQYCGLHEDERAVNLIPHRLLRGQARRTQAPPRRAHVRGRAGPLGPRRAAAPGGHGPGRNIRRRQVRQGQLRLS